MHGICTINENTEPYVSQNEETQVFRNKSRANTRTFRITLRAAIAGSGEEKNTKRTFSARFCKPHAIICTPHSYNYAAHFFNYELKNTNYGRGIQPIEKNFINEATF